MLDNKQIIAIVVILLIGLSGLLWYSGVLEGIKVEQRGSGGNSGNISQILFQGDCTFLPYDRCFWNSYSYGDAYAYAKLGLSYSERRPKYCYVESFWRYYYLTEVTLDYSCVGDKFTYEIGASDWGTCNENGCPGTSASKTGTITLQLAPSTSVPSIYAYCFDYDSSGDDWSWCGANLYFEAKQAKQYYVLGCCYSSDCESGQICDKRGDWETWKCVQDPCAGITCPAKCIGSIRYHSGRCDGSCNCYWVIEECEYGCKDGKCIDPCVGITCSDKCEGNTRYYDGYCEGGDCVYKTQECNYKCSAGECISECASDEECKNKNFFTKDRCVDYKCEHFINWTLIIIVILILISIPGGIYLWKKIKK